MKKRFFYTVALIAISGSAFAADLPSVKSAPIAPAPIWTGAYAGLNIGYSFGTNGNTNVAAMNNPWLFPASTPSNGTIAPNTLNSSYVGGLSYSGIAGNNQGGVLGGGQLGYNYQYNSKVVIGVETDFQGSGINSASKINGISYGLQPYQGGSNSPVAGAVTTAQGTSVVQSGLDWLGTVRGRLGYLFTPNLLVYGTGGFAYGGAYANISQSAVENVDHQRCMSNPSVVCTPYVPSAQNIWGGGNNQSNVLVGWTAGAGGEWMFMQNWSVKAEAMYWDLGRMNVNTSTVGVTAFAAPGYGFLANSNLGWGKTSVQYSGIIARAGVNYHFNLANVAPVVAKF